MDSNDVVTLASDSPDSVKEEMTTSVSPDIQNDLDAIALEVTTSYTLADAMRDGSVELDLKQAHGWGDGVYAACALKTAFIQAKRKGFA